MSTTTGGASATARVDTTGAKPGDGSEWPDIPLSQYFRRRAESDPDGSFVVENGRTLRNGEAWRTARRLAARLRAEGLAAGDRVVVQLPNWSEFAVIYLALSRLGIVVVPLMPVLGEREVAHAAQTTGATTYVTCGQYRKTDYLSMARRLRESCQDLTRLVIVRGEPADAADVLHYAELVAGDAGDPAAEDLGPEPRPDDGHIIAFTSGTESVAKGCYHTWNSYSMAAKNFAGITRFGRDSVELVPSPITHATGLAVGLLKPMLTGGSAVFMERWDPAAAVRVIEEHRCTHLTGAPVFLAGLLDAYDPASHDLSSLAACVLAGAPLAPSLVSRAAEVLPSLAVLSGYGQSEGLLVSACTLDDPPARALTVGRPVQGLTLRLVDEAGNDVPPGTTGEIWYSGPGVMREYWNNPESTVATLTPDRWVRSGDVGFVDDAGYLSVTSRIKEIIIRAGSNISSSEVEGLLAGHPDVAQAAVVGVPDAALGERVCAVIVPKDPATVPDLDEMRRFLREDCKLAPFKLPERSHVVDTLPVTATGKLRRNDLLKLVLGEDS